MKPYGAYNILGKTISNSVMIGSFYCDML
jgi:hypothetical protein